MKKRLFCLILAVCLALSSFLVSAQDAEVPSAAPTEAVQEEKGENGSNRWIFFLITSGLSLAVAIPLAIRSGNKKYGK